MGRGCLSLPDVGSFYAKLQKPSRQRVYGPQTVRFMLAQMEKQPQRPWPKDRIWSFKTSPKVFGSPMLDSVLKNCPLDREMVHWLKNRTSVFQAMWDQRVVMTADGSDADEVAARFDAMFAGVSLQSLLLQQIPHLHPVVPDGDDNCPQLPSTLLPPPLVPSDQYSPALSHGKTTDEGSFPISSSTLVLETPKPEPLDEPLDEPVTAELQFPPVLFHHLDCFQPAQPPSDSLSAATGSHIPWQHELPNNTSPTPVPASRRRAGSRRDLVRQRQRRRDISEKMRCLKKLMPTTNRKMDNATLLEEPALPHQADNYSYADAAMIGSDGCRSVLGLNQRQQTVLYSRGQCVVSVEQLEMAETAIMAHHHYQQQQQQQQQQQEQSMTMVMASVMFDAYSSSVSNFY
ncbi:hypothetical protein CRG98_037230 [Punica granatum]|uniref:BHLH domain-containing protein n=1 Tax=Punica granatum TaxID=22663 RepID=A0A2I0IEH2_PUNGR|nr:hypothetical protein CRG98_037230 [Punica granatum]